MKVEPVDSDDLFDHYNVCRAHAVRSCAQCKPWMGPDDVPASYLSLEVDTTFHCRCGYSLPTKARLFFGAGLETKEPQRLIPRVPGLPANIFAVAVRLPQRDDKGRIAHVYQLHPKCPRCAEKKAHEQEP